MDNNKKKTVAVTLERGMTVRNLVNSRFFTRLKESYNVIVVTPLHGDARFRAYVGNVTDFFPLHKRLTTPFERLIVGVHKLLIYNDTIRIRSRYGFKWQPVGNFVEDMKFWSGYVIFGLLLSKIKILRLFWRSVDRLFYSIEYYDDLFTKYDIDAVFISNIHYKDEVYLLRSAIKRKIQTIGMTKSWDNFSKDGYREKVDKLIVWNSFMRDEAVEFQGYSPTQISITGVPQFDMYVVGDADRDRAEFINTYGLDSEKKVILFGQESKFLSPDDAYVVEKLAEWIRNNNKPYQILIRPHFAHEGSTEEFSYLIDNKTVFIDTINNPSNFSDGWDFSVGHHRRLMLSIVCSDVVVTSVSTLILDAVASGTEVISYCFDADTKRPYKHSIKRLFEVLWFTELRECGLDEMTVYSETELCGRIEGVINGTVSTSYETVRKISKRFLHCCDDKAGDRLFGATDALIRAKR